MDVSGYWAGIELNLSQREGPKDKATMDKVKVMRDAGQDAQDEHIQVGGHLAK